MIAAGAGRIGTPNAVAILRDFAELRQVDERSRARSWPERRFSQAISEGDGISLIPLPRLRRRRGAGGGGRRGGARRRHDRGAPCPALGHGAAGAAAGSDGRRRGGAGGAGGGADAFTLGLGHLDDGLLEELVGEAYELGLDWGLGVHDEEELEQVLERLDPEILVLCERDQTRTGRSSS